MAEAIPDTERIVTIEDAAELQLDQGHVVRMETRPPNIEGAGAISQRELVINALRMRPDRIIIGECRGPEAFDMMQAMNTGHDGSMTTTHANTARDAFARLETMVMTASSAIPDHVIRQMLCSAVQIVLQCGRLTDGSRKILSINEVVGSEEDTVDMREIYSFERTAVTARGHVEGRFKATGHRPLVLERLRSYGVNINDAIFDEVQEVKEH